MLYAFPPVSPAISRVEVTDQYVLLASEAGLHRLRPVNEHILRVTYTQKERFSETQKPGAILTDRTPEFSVQETEETVTVRLAGLCAVIDKTTAAYTYYDKNGKLLLAEREHESKVLEEFQSYRLIKDENTAVEKVETVDGVKEVVRAASRIPAEKLYHTRLNLTFQKDEALYGLGQQEEGSLNLRGHCVYVHQANRKIAVPMLVSTKGYGLLMDTYSPMIFRDDVYGSYLYTQADEELDFYFIAGDTMDAVVRGYRELTGKAALLPKWAFGYLQSQERYETAEEILDIAKGYRERQIGLDCLVLDWMSWEDGHWGQKSFDSKRFPDPDQMIKTLHDEHVHFMISIWPTMSECTDNYKEMKEQDAFLDASNVYNALSKPARDLYWRQTEKGLFSKGVDAWWCDSSEPLTIEWTHPKRMEPDAMFHEYCKELSDHMPEKMTNAFPLYHAMTIYEGQRSVTEKKRVCNLTRSAYTGSQRLGTILWSGDIAANWKTLQNQIAVGLNFCASGLPYWTTDIGAFFVKKSNFWYWDGDYNDTTKDAGYLELFTRWYQWGAFLPVFRGHGTDCRRELWQFDGENGMFYDAMVKINQLRYCLMPYIYSEAGKVWLKDGSLMRMLAFEYASDPTTHDIKDQYLFGPSLMICPVTTPMYYEKNSVAIEAPKTRRVYLPKEMAWYDFWTGAKYEGGQWICVDAPIDQIPIFVKAGSILPMAKYVDHVVEQEEITYVVYPGQDAVYELYQDAGDGYGYETGEYSLTQILWKEELNDLCDGTGKKLSFEVRQ